MLKNILHICKTPCAGSPGIISNLINRYSHYNSKVFCKMKKISISDFSSDYVEEESVHHTELQNAVNNAHLLHFHNCEIADFPNINFQNKPLVFQLHTEPKGKPHILQKYRGNCITLAQKHVTLYQKHIYSVPNLVPIFDEKYMPDEKDPNIVNIFYSATSQVKYDSYENTCAGKGYEETVNILSSVQQKFGDKVKVNIFFKEEKEKVLRAKRKADIVIDEVVTGGYHLTSLEALSMECVTIANLNENVKNVLTKLTSCKEKDLPWFESNLSNLERNLEILINLKLKNPNVFKEWQEYNREWMIKYWHPQKMMKYFEEYYDSILGINTDPYKHLKYSSDIKRVRLDRQISKFHYDKERSIEFDIEPNQHKNRSCLILGAGPSINNIHMGNFLKEHNPMIFACNYYFMGSQTIKPDYWFCIDSGAFKKILHDLSTDVLNTNSLEYLDPSISVVANYPVKYVRFPNKRMWLTEKENDFLKYFNHKFEIERPSTVATIMLLNALYMGCNPIYLAGIDLNLKKDCNNYYYSQKAHGDYNNIFRAFNFNYEAIIKEFKMLKEEAKILDINVYDLNKNQQNFKVFPVYKGD